MNMTFNSSTGEFFARIKIDVRIDAYTEVHAMESGKGLVWYPHGYSVTIKAPDGHELNDKQMQVKEKDASTPNLYSFKIIDPSL